MEMQDLEELDQLADGTHAELQDKPKKTPTKDLNGAQDEFNKENSLENSMDKLGATSMDALTQASVATTSAATL